MNLTFQPGFPRRRNEDGTYDSMCLDCLQIVASHRPEAQLERFEEAHRCKSRNAIFSTRASTKPGFWNSGPNPSPAGAR